MENIVSKIKSGKVLQSIKNLLSWKFFPFITGAWVLVCYYCGQDMLSLYYIAITGTLTVLLLDDLYPLFSNFLFMNIMISRDHSPSVTVGASDYYFQPVIYTQIIILVCIYACAVVYKIVVTAKQGKFKPTPVFFGLCAFAAVLLLNGVLSKEYTPKNLMYGFFLAFLFVAVFTLMKDNLSCRRETFINVSYSFLALSVVLITELAVRYIQVENIIIDGSINRMQLMFGWGVYNTMGMLLLICIPSVMYLAAVHKRGYVFLLYSLAVFVAAVMSMSRQAMVGVVIIYPVCLFILLFKGTCKIINSIITGVAALILIILLSIYWEKISHLFSGLLFNLESGNGRYELWQQAIENFKTSPMFGMGFYADLFGDPNFDGLSLVPDMYHNTVMQLLGACGYFGLATYTIHRAQTITSFCRNITLERTFTALTIAALLILNLFDNHLFYLFPTIIYSALISLLVKSEKEKTSI